VWAADIKQIRTGEGWLYLAAVQDLFSRRIVGWSMQAHMRSELVIAALEMAVDRRRPATGTIHHSDHGGQPGLNRSSQQCLWDEPTDPGGAIGARISRLSRAVAAVVAEARPEGGPERR
jgi:transposase InsO family protein